MPHLQVWLCMDRHLRPTPCHPGAADAAELQRKRRCAHLRMPPLGHRGSGVMAALGSMLTSLRAALQHLLP